MHPMLVIVHQMHYSAIMETTYNWRLRELMAQRGLFHTTQLVPLLRERGVELSVSQAYRLSTTPPERLSMSLVVALMDIFGVGIGELVQISSLVDELLVVLRTAAQQTLQPERATAMWLMTPSDSAPVGHLKKMNLDERANWLSLFQSDARRDATYAAARARVGM